MAVTLDSYLPFDSGAGAAVQESQWRDMMKHMLGSASGVVRGFGNDFQTIGDSSGMQVKVNTGECFIRGHFGSSTAQKTLAIASNSSGNPRIDIVVLRCHFTNNNIVVDVVQGTPAASPTAPSVTQNTTMWETKLADVAVANGAVTITAGNVTDRRSYTIVYAQYLRTTSLNLANNTLTDMVFNSAAYQADGVTADSAMTVFTLTRAGLWQITAQAGFDPNATGSRLVEIRDSGVTALYAATQVMPANGTETHIQCQANEKFAAGQTIKVRVRQSAGGTLNTVANLCKLSFMWIGP